MNRENQGKCNIMCNCLYFTSNKLSRIIKRIAEEEFLKTGLSPSHAFDSHEYHFSTRSIPERIKHGHEY